MDRRVALRAIDREVFSLDDDRRRPFDHRARHAAGLPTERRRRIRMREARPQEQREV
jgi:hypothetical protein